MRTTTSALLAAALVAPTAFGLSYSHGHPHNARRHGAQIARRRLDDHVNTTAQRMTRKARRGTASSSSSTKETYQSTAIWWAEAGWIGSCGENISDDAMIIALPLALYPDVSTASSLCGTSVSVSAPSTGKTITATVIGASDRDNFTTFSRAAYEALGGNLDVGELAIEFQLVDGTAPASTAGAAATVSDGAALKAGKGTSSPVAATSSVAPSSSHSSGSASDSGSGSGASSSTATPVQVKANVVPSSSSTTSYVAPTTSDASSSSSSWTSTTTWAPEPTTTAWDSASAASASAASKSSADAAWASSSSAAADAAYKLWASSSSAAALAASQSAADAAWASSSSAAAAAASISSADAAWAASSSSSAAAAAAKATQQAAASDSGSSSSSGGGSGQVYSGGIATFFWQNGVAGNCGQVHSDSTLLVALPTATYAGGSHCGQYVSIKRTDTGQTIKALVADSCPTCDNNSCLDLSWGAFSALGGTQSMGVFDITWQFV